MSSIWARCGRFSETLLNLFQAADRDRKQARRPGHACRSRLPERAGAAPHGGLLPPAARGGPQPRCGGGRGQGPVHNPDGERCAANASTGGHGSTLEVPPDHEEGRSGAPTETWRSPQRSTCLKDLRLDQASTPTTWSRIRTQAGRSSSGRLPMRRRTCGIAGGVMPPQPDAA